MKVQIWQVHKQTNDKEVNSLWNTNQIRVSDTENFLHFSRSHVELQSHVELLLTFRIIAQFSFCIFVTSNIQRS